MVSFVRAEWLLAVFSILITACFVVVATRELRRRENASPAAGLLREETALELIAAIGKLAVMTPSIVPRPHRPAAHLAPDAGALQAVRISPLQYPVRSDFPQLIAQISMMATGRSAAPREAAVILEMERQFNEMDTPTSEISQTADVLDFKDEGRPRATPTEQPS